MEKNVLFMNSEIIRKAYEFSKNAHKGQKRLSGEDYFTHCVETAKILSPRKRIVPSFVVLLSEISSASSNVRFI